MSESSEIPNLATLLKRSTSAALSGVHTSMPGRIEKYDSSVCKAEVKPLVKVKYNDGKIESFPVISNVPVIFPRNSNSIISLPIKKGDLVLLLFSERSIDIWLSGNGAESLPRTNSKFDLSDAIAIPGLYPFGVTSEALSEGVLIKHNDARIELNKDGKLAIGNSQNELLDLIDQILDGIAAITITHEGVHAINNAATFTAIKTQLATIKGSLS